MNMDVISHPSRCFARSLMPALAYILDMNHRTHGAYGVNEVILASALAAIVFPIFSVQPLTFVGVTGLINLVSNAALFDEDPRPILVVSSAFPTLDARPVRQALVACFGLRLRLSVITTRSSIALPHNR